MVWRSSWNEPRYGLTLPSLRYPPAPKKLGDYFSLDYLMWNCQGRLTYSQVNQRKMAHWESLATLGYVQRRTFTLKHRTLTEPMVLQKLQELHRNACDAAGIGPPFVTYSTDWSNTVTVLARPREVQVFEAVIAAFDSTNTPPK